MTLRKRSLCLSSVQLSLTRKVSVSSSIGLPIGSIDWTKDPTGRSSMWLGLVSFCIPGLGMSRDHLRVMTSVSSVAAGTPLPLAGGTIVADRRERDG